MIDVINLKKLIREICLFLIALESHNLSYFFQDPI